MLTFWREGVNPLFIFRMSLALRFIMAAKTVAIHIIDALSVCGTLS